MESSKKVKVTDLPLYPCCCKDKKESCPKSESANVIEPYITQTRKEIESMFGPVVGDSFQRLGEIISTSKAHTYDLIEVVRDDQNQASRATFITSAAFIGYLIGRRGFFRRSLFALIGAGSAAAICEPKMAKDYAEVSLEIAKKKLSELYEQSGGPEYFKNINWPSIPDIGIGSKSSTEPTAAAQENKKQQ